MSAPASALVVTRAGDGALRVGVRVQPRASRDGVKGVREGALEVSLTAPPVDGEANSALIAFLAKRLGVAKRDVTIVQGETGRNKVLELRGVSEESVRGLVPGGG